MTELDDTYVTPTRVEIERFIPFGSDAIFSVLTDPNGHVDIDSTGMLQSATGDVVTAAGDRFVVHMDRESLGDYDLGRYDVEVVFTTVEPNAEIAWTILGTIKPPIGHIYGYRLTPMTTDDGTAGTMVTSYYDWTDIDDNWKAAEIFPVISPSAVKATLGILERVVRQRAGD